MGKYEANIATGKQWLKLAGITLVILFTVLRTRARACDTWVAMRDATTDHSVILAKNSDRPPMEAQPAATVNMRASGAKPTITTVTSLPIRRKPGLSFVRTP